LDRAEARGVRGVLVPATGAEDLDHAVSIATDHPTTVVAAAGVHPHEASTLDAALKRRLERALGRDEVVAVGEIGLDYHYMNSPREDQLTALEYQLDLAIDASMPVVLHNRDSWVDLEPRLEARRHRLRGVTHSFTEGPEEAKRVVDLELVVGISGMVTFKQADNIRQMALALRPAQVMVETDSPFLAPVPHRGRPNEPAFVVEVGRKLAELWSVDVAAVASESCSVFFDLFEPPSWSRK
jgi:TatD DNase family protein